MVWWWCSCGESVRGSQSGGPSRAQACPATHVHFVQASTPFSHPAAHHPACPPCSLHCPPFLYRRSLRQLLQYEGEGSVEDVFCQSFTVDVPGFGDMRTVPLKEGGADVPVTGAVVDGLLGGV